MAFNETVLAGIVSGVFVAVIWAFLQWLTKKYRGRKIGKAIIFPAALLLVAGLFFMIKPFLPPSPESCENLAVVIQDNCRAYDRNSGLTGSPSASCGISLDAGSERFFYQDQVTVVSQSYRKRAGATAINAIVPVPPEGDSPVVKFSGRIGCTNSSGAGRTCESKATVSAKSYPMTCLKTLREQTFWKWF